MAKVVDFTARREAAIGLEVSGSERVPVVGDWGYCTWADGPGPMNGESVKFFSWFRNREAALECVEKYVPFQHPASGERTQDEMASEVARILAGSTQSADDASLLGQINDVLKGTIQFDWIGPFKSLLNDDEEFAKGIRSDFRRLVQGIENDDFAPIEPADYADFAQFTRDYPAF